MSDDRPIIHASLVDARNVGTDKEIKLELRIPAEAAAHFLEVFGWPTKAAPVSVALVPLKAAAAVVMDATLDDDDPRPDDGSDDAFKRIHPDGVTEKVDRVAFTALPRMKQAGIRCREPGFWSFLNTKFPKMDPPIANAAEAASAVRWWCCVESRRELDNPKGAAGALWDRLEGEYWATQHGMH